MDLRIKQIPESQSGKYKIERNARSQTYLKKGSDTLMSDSNKEMADLTEFKERVHGNVLINGLGLGLCLGMALEKESVKLIIVNEISEDVIKLIAPYYIDKRLTINHVDAFKWVPPEGLKFDIIWHDISNTEMEISLQDIAKLYKKYSKFLKYGGWQSSWETTVLGIKIMLEEKVSD